METPDKRPLRVGSAVIVTLCYIAGSLCFLAGSLFTLYAQLSQ